MSREKSTTMTLNGGWGLASILTLIFVVLKLAHVVDWVWVLAPLWVSFGFNLLVIGIALIVTAVVSAVKR